MARRDFNWDAIPVKTGVTADPAAGANPAALTVPAGKRWKVETLYNLMVTAVAVANRQGYVLITDGTNNLGAWVESIAQTASLTCLHTFSTGAPAATAGSAGVALSTGMGGIELKADWTIQLLYAVIQAADDAGPMRLTYREAPL